MRRFILTAWIVGICVGGCSRPTAGPNATPAMLAGTPYSDWVIAAPISHENLTIFPILSKSAKKDDRFITLDEGLAAGTVKIIEVGASEGWTEATVEDDPFGEAPPQLADAAMGQSADDGDQVAQVEQTAAVTVDENPFDEGPQDAVQPAANGAPPSIAEGESDLFGSADVAAQPMDEMQGEAAENRGDRFGPPELADVDGDVNKLMVLNTSGQPLYLMPGEVISGGKQDRTIGQEMVIASSDEPTPIDVFCVEHGRWTGRSAESTAAHLTAAANYDANLSLAISQTASVAELAEEAQRGSFVASVGQLNKDGRMAVQNAGEQGRVWEEVAKTNSKVGNNSESSDFASNYTSVLVAKDFAPFIEQLKSVGETQQIVGVAVAVNGKMLSVDVFESTPLFKKFWPKLLKSYALDAVAAQDEAEPDSASKTATVEDCIAFLNELQNSKTETAELADGQTTVKRESTTGVCFSYHDVPLIEGLSSGDASEANGAGGYFGGGGVGGAMGGGVHTSVLAK